MNRYERRNAERLKEMDCLFVALRETQRRMQLADDIYKAWKEELAARQQQLIACRDCLR